MQYVPHRVLRSAELNLLTVLPGKLGKYGSRSLMRASANLWNSLRGERASWRKNSPTVESFKRNLKLCLFNCMLLYADSSALEYSIIGRYTNILYYYQLYQFHQFQQLH